MSVHTLVQTTILLVLCYYVLVPYYLLVFAALFAIQGYRLYRQRQRVTPPGPVLITGCDTGFGEMTSLRLDSLGVRVFAGCLTQEGADRLKARASDKLIAFVMDVTKDEDVQAAAQRIAACGLGLWGVINNAGIAAGLGIELLPFSGLQKCIDVNFYGTVRVTRAMLPFLKKSAGRVINIASVAGRVSLNGAMPYCASKYCVEAFSDALRREVRVWGVSVVCVEPGYHNTPILTDLCTRFDPVIAQIPADLRAEYGDKYFEELRAGLQHIKTMRKGDPVGVRDALVDALFSTEPPTHRLVGLDANYLFGPLSHMPGFVQDFVLKLVEKAGPRQPVPASARFK